MKNVLIINAHQYYEEESKGNLSYSMVEIAKELFEQKNYTVKTTFVEQGYNIKEEVDKHSWADIIITQVPVFWFGSPWIHKKYLDEIFNSGLSQKKLIATDGRSSKDLSKQYGMGGKMQGKRFLLSSSWNAPKAAFGDKDQILYEGKDLDDALIALSTPYKFCGCEVLKGFACFDVIKNPNIENNIKEYKNYLNTL